MYKISFYVPADSSETLKAALFGAGAGRIGGYDQCCWETAGIGQFRPLKGSSPHLGITGRLEKVEELKVELVCDETHIKKVISTLVENHPYEEPAYAVWKIQTLETLDI
jgi:hypothetical protein